MNDSPSPVDVSSDGTALPAEVPLEHAPSADPILSEAFANLQAELSGRTRPREFSQESMASLLEREAEFVTDVGIEAIRIAKRSRSDVVSKADIEDADRRIRESNRGGSFAAWAEPFGGILLGAGLSQLLSVIGDDNVPTLAYVLGTVAATIGVGLLVFGVTKRMG